MQFAARTALAALALAAVTSATPAAAGIPIPCTGDKSFKMAETGVKRQDGRTVYLGYKYSGCSSGEWIGYIDGRNYMTLKDESQATMLAIVGGMKALPEPPGRMSNPKEFWVEWLWAVLIGLGAIGTVFSSIAKAAEPPARPNTVRA